MILGKTKEVVKKFFNNGHERSVKAKKNVALSFILKFIHIVAGIALVPLMLEYLGEENYGVWLTIASTILWFEFFDVGLGHGLRNKLAEAKAKGNVELSRKYVSTGYAVVGILSILFFSLSVGLNGVVNWADVLNTTTVSESEVAAVVLVVTTGFSIRLVLSLLFAVLYADQRPALKNLIDTIVRVLILATIFLLIKWPSLGEQSLVMVGAVFTGIPLLLSLGFSLVLFNTKYKEIAPKISEVEFSLVRDLMGIGGSFFIIQICATIVYSTDNMIISHLFSPASVTPYEVAHKYFAMALMAFGIVMQPVWSAVTEAYSMADLNWIKKSVNALIKLWILVVLGLAVMLLASPLVYKLWLSDKLTIPFSLSAFWAAFVAVQALNMIFVQVVNGIGKVRLQMIIGILGAAVNIPLSIFLARNMGMGITGVVAATLSTQVIAIGFTMVQCHKAMAGELHGIWDK